MLYFESNFVGKIKEFLEGFARVSGGITAYPYRESMVIMHVPFDKMYETSLINS